MADIKVYGYATSLIVDDFHVVIIDALKAYTPTQFIMANTAGLFTDQLVFLGDFSVNSGGVSSGTITELKVESSSGALEADITGVSVSIANGSFNTGAFLATGSTYHDMTGNSSLEGYGNDTYYAGAGTRIFPGAGVNTIHGGEAGARVYFTGSFAAYSFAADSSGGLVVIDSASSRNGYNDISGSATLVFEGDSTTVQDTDGALSLNLTAAKAAGYAASSINAQIAVTDSAANVSAYLDSLETLAANGRLSSITLSGSGILTVTASQFSADAKALHDVAGSPAVDVTGLTATGAVSMAATSGIAGVAVSDSAADVLTNLDALQGLAAHGKLTGITLSDGGIPTLAVTPAQSVAAAAALAKISSYYVLDIAAAGNTSQTIDGVAGRASVIQFSGSATNYTITPAITGGLTVTEGSITDHILNATALQFSDGTVFVASQTPASSNGVSSFQVATLYAAVLGRTPDAAGLGYYEAQAAASPSTPITQYAEQFLQSPEYTANKAHNYGQNAAGDASFVIDTYQNLLHRGPGAGDVAWYQANVINPILGSATPGTSGYTAAELAAHAAVLADFSQSAEFKSDVQVTAQTPSSAQHWLVLV